MNQSYRGGFIKPKWALGLCVLGVLAAVAILLATPPITENSVYKTAVAKHRPISLSGTSRLSLNNSVGQPASQAQTAAGAVLGASVSVSSPPASSSQNSMSVSSAPANNYPAPISPSPSSDTNPAVPAYFYPVDPPPCKFRLDGSSIGGCGYCADYFRYPCGCGYRGADLACIAPE